MQPPGGHNLPGDPQSPHELPDALSTGHARGRGAQLNPANRFEGFRLHVLGDHMDEVVAENPDGTKVRTLIYPDRSRTIINRVDSPDIGFNWTINPYRGCEHGCIYCYARPSHEMLGLSCGLDFETRITAKLDAPGLLRRELARPSWRGDPIVLSGVTDPYQPVEARLKLTRRILEVLAESGQPISVITKNRLILRDLDLIGEMGRRGLARCAISITTLDPHLARVMEPRASAPRDRLRAVRELTDAGIPVTAMVAPIIPGLNDREMPAVMQAASEAGAVSAGWVLLRLPYQIKGLFLDWLAREFPDRADRVESLIRQTRGGELYDPRPLIRQRGQGPIAEQIAQMFKLYQRRYRLDRSPPALKARPKPRPQEQPGLFG